MVKKPAYIHPTAEVHGASDVGNGSMIWNWSKIRENVRIGENCIIGQCCYVDFDITIGDRCKVQNGVSLYHGLTVGNDVFIGPNATLTNDLHPRAHNENWKVSKTVILDGASIGANATIICGITIGKNSMIAAGAIVTRDVPAHALVMGHPARIVDYVNRSGKRLHCDINAELPSSEMLNG
jgi:UDP-2-acetamido-3-amino-2,3-dideoxy-glucuronate N-acetyltransferase|tara:strand:+ start:38483 stop:39025 length:543 start_codon:yes stop_codon:yes gene_type:complete